MSSVIFVPRLGMSVQTQTYRRSLMTAAQPLARYGARGKARVTSGYATLELHHVQGHDQWPGRYDFS